MILIYFVRRTHNYRQYSVKRIEYVSCFTEGFRAFLASFITTKCIYLLRAVGMHTFIHILRNLHFLKFAFSNVNSSQILMHF